jgi:hypothetical protein
MNELKNEVNDDGADNRMRPYKIQFPYQVKFNLSDDDNRTEVIINTISEEITFARTSKDALLQKERNDVVSKEGYTNHIVNWVAERMYRMDLDECAFSYTGSPDANEMTDAELDEYAREVISSAK